MINFPLNPELNEEYIHQNAYKYKWDGVKWIAVERVAPVTSAASTTVVIPWDRTVVPDIP